MNIVYYGASKDGRVVVRFQDAHNVKDTGSNLLLRFDLAQHAEQFAWGKVMIGERESKALVEGAAQLALAICAHALADDDRGLRLHQRFKLRVMTEWKAGEPWAISAEEVAAVCDKIEGDELTPQQRAAIDNDKAVVERETGRGVESAIVWDTDEQGNRFRPRGADDAA